MKFNPFKKLMELFRPAAGEEKKPPPPAQVDININNSSFSHPQNHPNMAMFNYGVGGNEVKVDANEAINEIQHNKTMLISQLTSDDPVQPENVSGMKTVEEVFRYFRPNVDVEMETADGQSVKENLKFTHLGDFTPKSLTSQSPFLNTLNIQQDQYSKIMKQLKANKVLQSMIDNPETKEAMVSALKQMAEELENSAR